MTDLSIHHTQNEQLITSSINFFDNISYIYISDIITYISYLFALYFAIVAFQQLRQYVTIKKLAEQNAKKNQIILSTIISFTIVAIILAVSPSLINNENCRFFLNSNIDK